MIQRVQSLYLLLAVIAGVLMWVFPVLSFQIEEMVQQISLCGYGENALEGYPNTIVMMALNIGFVILSLVIILLYKNRNLQRKLMFLNLLLLMGLLVDVIYVSEVVGKLSSSEVTYQIGAFMPMFSILMLILANRAIRKDEDLVRSIDRLR